MKFVNALIVFVLTVSVSAQTAPAESQRQAGETPIIAVAPAMANAMFMITGERVRSLPFRPSFPKGATSAGL